MLNRTLNQMSKDYVVFYKMVYHLSVIVENMQTTQNLMKV